MCARMLVLLSLATFAVFVGVPADASAAVSETITSNTTFAAGEYFFDTLTITSSSTLTIKGNSTATTSFKGVIIHAQNIIVEAGSTISAYAGGYPRNSGPGAPRSYQAGASYGGAGEGNTTTSTYGSALYPAELGSGAYGAGGGAIRLVVSGTLTNNGTIRADGQWSGSGGSINVDTQTLEGAGGFSARGSGPTNVGYYIGPGGGGRIIIRYAQSSFTGNLNASGGCSTYVCGSSGTAGLIDTTTNALILLNSWRFQFDDGPFTFSKIIVTGGSVTSDSGVSISADQLTVDNGGSAGFTDGAHIHVPQVTLNATSTLSFPGTEDILIDVMTISGGSRVTVAPGQALDLSLAELTITKGSSIDVSAKGYSSKQGTGKPIGYSGASYGGIGLGNTATSTYGSADEPTDFGSGGGDGAGGGAVSLAISGTFVNEGSVIANGSWSASGGSILVRAHTLVGSGSFSANGGGKSSSSYYSSGGGGRIAIYTDTATSSFAGTVKASGACFYILSAYRVCSGDGTTVFKNTGPKVSNVLFLPGIKGSVLKVNNDTVWPPSFWSDDLAELSLTVEGNSVNPIVVDGILEKFYGTPIYSGFATFMNELVASGTTTEWKSLPYDWRFSPERILSDGIRTSVGIVDPLQEVEALAARSETGKVTIVAHSMGGLLGKVIIKKLQEEGKENLVDSFIMVGTPQLGTPQAAASLLHGDDEGIAAGFIVNPALARKIAQNFQSTYDLLPSPRYFAEVTEPISTFDPDAAFAEEWRNYWGPAIDTYAEFFSFITGSGVARINPEFSQLWIPEILRTDLVENARGFHEEYDTYTFPSSIRVVQVAGWGAPTVKAIKYKTRHFMQNYEPIFTIEGDKTVVYPSAVSSVADETLFFNLEKYRKEQEKSTQHRNLLNATPIRDIIRASISQESISETSYLTRVNPIPTDLVDQLVISTHSPVILGAYDQSGNFSGINPNQALGADILSITEDIPGSTFLSFGGSQYLFLPKEGSYSVIFEGVGTGPADVDIESFTNDTTALVATYTDISVTASTSAVFTVNSFSPQDAHIQVDSNNDGQVDTYIAPDNQSLTLEELLTNLKTTIQNLSIKEKFKADFLKKISNIQKKIEKQKNKKSSKAMMGLEKKIIKEGRKDQLSDADVAEIMRLLEQIERAL